MYGGSPMLCSTFHLRRNEDLTDSL
jgi:hypothetical protein